jgi:hypothetical protein
MFARIARSWMIFKNSLSVLNCNKKLLIFPLLSACFVIMIALLIFSGIFAVVIANPKIIENFNGCSSEQAAFSKTTPIPAAASTCEGSSKLSESPNTQTFLGYFTALLATRPAGAESSKVNASPDAPQYAAHIFGVTILFIAYFISVFLATFFNVAFYSEIIHGLNSEPVFLMRGFKFAFGKRGSIAMWALLGATVGVTLKFLEERFGWIGRLVIRFIGLAWNVVTVFAVPVIICEKNSFNPIKNVKTSASVIRKTWGESLVGFIGISALSGLLIIPILLLSVALAIASAIYVSVVLAIIIGVLGVAAIVAVSILLDVAQKIYIASLYLYATTGFLNAAYSEELMQTPWKVKR